MFSLLLEEFIFDFYYYSALVCERRSENESIDEDSILNPNLMYGPSLNWETRQSLVFHFNCGTSGWDFSVSKNANGGFYLFSRLSAYRVFACLIFFSQLMSWIRCVMYIYQFLNTSFSFFSLFCFLKRNTKIAFRKLENM